ncbi:hypothetical protein BJV82DRAFT_610038 [Fennellomyces sp. T-0311]|nr:hypothetical protein BJV82DRAFT_610038 [Fennellomyces sp. T-0311]
MCVCACVCADVDCSCCCCAATRTPPFFQVPHDARQSLPQRVILLCVRARLRHMQTGFFLFLSSLPHPSSLSLLAMSLHQRFRPQAPPPPPPPHRQPPCFDSGVSALEDCGNEPEPPPPWLNPNRPLRHASWRKHYAPSTSTRPTINTSRQPVKGISIGSYPALQSHVANELRLRIMLSDRLKDGIEYKNAFDGQEAVDKLCKIINSKDRTLALRVGRVLGSQRLFHDVSYERRLVDSSFEIYQFDDRVLISTLQDTGSPGTMTMSSSGSSHSNSSGNSSTSSSVLGDPPAAFYEFRPDSSDLAASAAADEFPNGVFTDLTFCYSPTCIYDNKPCYSYFCPKRIAERQRQQSVDSTLERSSLSLNSLQYQRPPELWVDVVPKEVRDSVSKTEWKRQEAIFELVCTEENFIKTIEYVNEMWIEPIRNSDDIIPDLKKREKFIRSVFANTMEIYDLHVQLLTAFQERQSRSYVVNNIGDVMLEFVDRFDPFIEYGSSQYNAKYVLEQERTVNRAFADFAMKTEEHPVSRKLPLNGFLSQPTTRIGRYNLLLEGILKHTPENNPDRQDIPKAMEIIKGVLTRMNATTGRAKNRFDLMRINAHLRFKNPEDAVDLRLMDEEREIIKEDKLRKTHNSDSTEYQVVLFDHYLAIARVKVENAVQHYIIQRPPIPLELISISISEPGKGRKSNPILPHYYMPSGHAASMGPHLAMRGSMDSGTGSVAMNHNGTGGGLIGSRPSFPITFTHLGRKGAGSITLYSSSVQARKPWFDKIRDLQAESDKRHAWLVPTPAVKEHHFFVLTKINHLVTFNDGRQYVLAADDGVYVGHTERSSVPRKVLAIERVTQVEVLASAQKLLVLADRTLYEYALSVVNGSTRDRPAYNKLRTHVPFFHVGFCLKRHLVCVPRISALQTTITVFESQRFEEYHRRHQNSQGRVPSPLDVRMREFSVYGVPSEVWDIELSKSLMLVTTPRGVIILDMRDSNKMFRPLLNHDDPSLKFITVRERDHLLPTRKRIVMFRTPEAQHILCYDEFAFYIDGQGNRIRHDFLIQWEGTPEAYAFSYPYIMAFDPSFIEIRNIFTGEREQVIRGNNIKCLSHHFVYRSEIPMVFGVMTDPQNECYQQIFRLDRLPSHRQSAPPRIS